MKKSAHSVMGSLDPEFLRKVLIVKLTTLLIFVLNVTALANTWAQNERATLKVKSAKLAGILKEIESQTKYRFVYGEDLMEGLDKPMSIQANNTPVKKILEDLLISTDLNFNLLNDYLVVLSKTERINAIVQTKLFGSVTDKNGNRLAGVTVKVVEDDRRVAMTNGEGAFIIDVKEGESILFTYLGHNPQRVKVTAAMLASSLKISLTSDMNQIDEIVAVGYGSMKRKDLTGSVASVDVNEIKNTPFVSIDQALAGKATGVQVTQADGSPGGVARIRIRGGASLVGGNDPLYIIDGVQMPIQNRYVQAAADIVNPVERLGKDDAMNSTVGSSFARGLNSLAGLNINDIETIDILKDASATAIYGSRAANGVVIITTKKGKLNQKPVLEANYYTGVSKAITEKLLSTEEYIQLMIEGSKNLNSLRASQGKAADAMATSIINDPAGILGTGDTDWLDLVTRTGRTQNVDLSVRGGGSGSRYYTSLAYADQKGTLLGTDFSRLSGKVNLDNEITNKLRLITNLDYGFTKNNITNGIYSSALFAPPTLDPYAADGSPAIFLPASFGSSAYMGIQNPMALLTGKNESKNNMLLGSLSLEYDILKDLKFRSTVSANYNNYHQSNYIPGTVMVSATSGAKSSDGGIATQGYTNQLDMFYENTLTWDRQFNEDNRINVLVGTSWQKSNTNSFTASGQGFPDDEFLNGLSSAALALPPKATESQNSLLSFYARANYAFKERYLLTLTGRSDESSKFPKNNRTGYFPSFGVAWRMSEEGFMKNQSVVNELKLRASAGKTGTQNLGDNLFYTLFTPLSYASTNALVPSQLGNDKIRWESTWQKDFGVDAELFQSRLRVAFGYYEKNSQDLLMSMNTALSTGFSSALMNVASIQNQGVELDLRGDIIRKKDFNWNLALNISNNKAIVTKINRDFTDPNAAAQSDPFWSEQSMGNTILREGEPVGLIFGYKYKGVIKTQEQLDAYKAESLYAQYGLLENLGLGYPMYETHQEGTYKGYWNRDVIGRAQPKYYGGITNSITYKSFNVIALTTFSKGGDLLYLPELKSFGMSDRGNRNTRALLPYYSAENPDADRPTLILKETNTYGTGVSSAQVFDASYIKLKSISLNYMLPQSFISKIGVNSAMVYVSGSNLFTITKYPGPDPEVSSDPYSLIGGYTDAAGYPSMRQYTFGLRFGF